MDEACPITGEWCAVKANFSRMSEHAKTTEELLAFDGLKASVSSLLERGNCSGTHREKGDLGDIMYSGSTVYCANDRLPEVAQKIKDVAAQPFSGFSELFGIENIGKIHGNY